VNSEDELNFELGIQSTAVMKKIKENVRKTHFLMHQKKKSVTKMMMIKRQLMQKSSDPG